MRKLTQEALQAKQGDRREKKSSHRGSRKSQESKHSSNTLRRELHGQGSVATSEHQSRQSIGSWVMPDSDVRNNVPSMPSMPKCRRSGLPAPIPEDEVVTSSQKGSEAGDRTSKSFASVPLTKRSKRRSEHGRSERECSEREGQVEDFSHIRIFTHHTISDFSSSYSMNAGGTFANHSMRLRNLR